VSGAYQGLGGGIFPLGMSFTYIGPATLAKFSMVGETRDEIQLQESSCCVLNVVRMKLLVTGAAEVIK